MTDTKATSLPDFIPDENAKSLANHLGLDLLSELAAFKDYHSSKGSVFIDWQAALRTWLRRVPQFAPRGPMRRTTKDDEAQRQLMQGFNPTPPEPWERREQIVYMATHGIYRFIEEIGDPDTSEGARVAFNKAYVRDLEGEDKWEHWKDLCAEEGVEAKPKHVRQA